MSALAPTLQAFFSERLINEKGASQHTIAAYRDTMRLLLRFAAEHSGKPPTNLAIDDLHAPLIGAFLTVAGNFVADIALTIADPRIRLS